ncbi:MAG: sugar phosphate isomerase/epimerase [Clostridia bacterium]|nr:sugar phosphate isomerase/epimerase [Clostridia bacterium]
MDLGMPTLIENKTLSQNLSLSRELGLDFVELNMNVPDYQLENLKKLTPPQDVYYTIHLDENLNFADFNKGVAQAYFDTVKETIAVAKNIGAPVLNMHMNHGVYFTLPDKKIHLFSQYEDDYMSAVKRFGQMCCEEIGDENIKISVENTDGFMPFEKKAIEYFLTLPVFTLTWDVGHSHSANDVDDAFLLSHKDSISHFHMHDAVGKDHHLAFGTGKINLKEKFALAKANNSRCVIETKTIESLRASVKYAKEHFYSLISTD